MFFYKNTFQQKKKNKMKIIMDWKTAKSIQLYKFNL